MILNLTVANIQKFVDDIQPGRIDLSLGECSLGEKHPEPDVIEFIGYSFVRQEPWFIEEDGEHLLCGHIFRCPLITVEIHTHTY